MSGLVTGSGMVARIRHRRGIDAGGLAAIGAGIVAATLAGALSTSHPFWAVGLVLALVLALLIAMRTGTLLILLVATMFVESLTLGGGFAVGRLAGGFSLIVIAYLVLGRQDTLLPLNALLITAGCFGAWMLLSFYWASSGGEVFRQLLSYLLAVSYMLAFALLLRSRRDLRDVLAMFAVGALVFGLAAFGEYVSSGGVVRASGLQGDPNYFAEYQVIALPAVLALATLERRWRSACYLAVGVIILSVVSSLSRGGLVALIVVVAATIALPSRMFFATAREKKVYAFAVGGAMALALLLGSGNFVARAESIIHPTDRASGRLDIWSAAWQAWKAHPWLGIGEGNFRANSLHYLQTTPGVNTAASYVTAGREVHNAYLETLTELGPVGLLLFLLVIALTAATFSTVFLRARRARDTHLARASISLLLSLLAYAVTAFFLSSELQKPLWILTGIALALDRLSRQTRPPARERPSVNVLQPLAER